MSWTISGTYVAGCSCAVLCSCPYDGQPRDAEGGTECLGTAVFHVADGDLDGLDLSGVDFAFYNHFPSNLSSGDWKVGLVVDSAASDEQAGALERILSGRAGGPFEQLSQFYGEYLGMERAGVSLSGGDRTGLTVEGRTELSYEPLTGPDGSATKIKNAMFGFAPEFEVGRTTGRSDAFGLTYEASYGETAEYVFSSEEPEGAAQGRA
ncbi:DUF1326 domain-containing protein [Streptomyces justiciae]|uniref:DUF1326 domain-containing protein n=1 Tax=Streptomyces justiciae TaxID=2780140 RepID=A0ABU3LRG5_9ACTN|nr:DUF1326 domain-containing protein [Streptomyces justiciae]MBE8473559.1 DUF1326 domain-containing protein [Streptomyces justiciae]MCW8378190.1 DUF1326 domain-containing protein [Streptomyces justiciae]MDT7841816.1 DUF1326 domain-containing protein [Streptomyces justiciae]